MKKVIITIIILIGIVIIGALLYTTVDQEEPVLMLQEVEVNKDQEITYEDILKEAVADISDNETTKENLSWEVEGENDEKEDLNDIYNTEKQVVMFYKLL